MLRNGLHYSRAPFTPRSFLWGFTAPLPSIAKHINVPQQLQRFFPVLPRSVLQLMVKKYKSANGKPPDTHSALNTYPVVGFHSFRLFRLSLCCKTLCCKTKSTCSTRPLHVVLCRMSMTLHNTYRRISGGSFPLRLETSTPALV